MNQLPRISKGNLSEQVYGAIRSSLMNGRFSPGERLTIAGLAERMGVSITPIREAIFRLVSERALEMRAATSIHVRRLTPPELREIQVIRHHLEGEGAAQAARRINARSLQDLEELQVRFTKAAASDPLEASRLNRAFHFRVAEAAEMPLLFATIEGMWAQMGPLIHLYHLNTPPRVVSSASHPHYAVLAALAAHDADAARSAIQADIALGSVMVAWLESNGAAEAAP